MKKTTEFFWIFLVLTDLLFMAGVIMFFFSKSDHSALQTEKNQKIGVCYRDLSNSFYQVLNTEIRSEIEKRGDQLIIRDSLLSQDIQNRQIEDMINEGVSAIILAPVDYRQITQTLQKAKENDVKIIVVDTPVEEIAYVDCMVTSDNYDVGVQLANYLKSMKSDAKILVLKEGGLRASEERTSGFRQVLESEDSFSIVGEEECDGTMDSAMQAVRRAIEDGEEFDCVLAVNDNYAVGAIAGCENLSCKEEIMFLSADGSPEGKKLINDSIEMVSAAQFPSEMGKKAVESLYLTLEGASIEKENIVPVKLITKYTIGSYDLDKWQ